MAIANRAISAISIGLGLLFKSAKSFDLAIGKRNLRNKEQSTRLETNLV